MFVSNLSNVFCNEPRDNVGYYSTIYTHVVLRLFHCLFWLGSAKATNSKLALWTSCAMTKQTAKILQTSLCRLTNINAFP